MVLRRLRPRSAGDRLRRRIAQTEAMLCARMAACLSFPDLSHLLQMTCDEMGFSYFALLHHRSLVEESPSLVRIENYPRAWAAELIANHDPQADPVHEAACRINIAFTWDRLDQIIRLGAGQRRLLERARIQGLGCGLTIPANVPGEPSGSCSFAHLPDRLPLPAVRRCAERVGGHAFLAARRIAGYTARSARPHLSRRELDCLRLVARGKTDWEIAAILGLGHETVRFYVKRARAAYDVTSRTQLALCGLRDGWIGFEEAIPPSG